MATTVEYTSIIDTANVMIPNVAGNVNRWIKDGNHDSYWGHFEQPINSDIQVGMSIIINDQLYWILDIIGDGTAPNSVLLNKVVYTGRINAIYPATIKNGVILTGGGDYSQFTNFKEPKLKDHFGKYFAGDGHDGDVIISTSGNVINSYYKVTEHTTTTITLNSTSGLNIGDEILLIQMQSSDSRFGQYETFKITNISGNILTIAGTIRNIYALNVYSARPSNNAQVVRIPNYNNLTINSGCSIVPASWNGETGGIVAFRVKEKLVNNGTITATGYGFRGQPHYYNGEGHMGWIASGSGAYGGGGGVGWYCYETNVDDTLHQSGGGGGGNYSETDLSLTRIGLGCGGGAGGYIQFWPDKWRAYYNGNSGGNGGGIILIGATDIVNSGTISANGNGGAAGVHYISYTYQWNRYTHHHYTGGGGGGGGGTILIQSGRMSNSGTVTTTPGAGGTGTSCYSGGNGGTGIIRLDIGIFSGNNPTNSQLSKNILNPKPRYGTPFILKMSTKAINELRTITSNYTNDTFSRYYANGARCLLSFDKQKSWQYYSSGNWNKCTLDQIRANGMTFDQLNALTVNEYLGSPAFYSSANDIYIAILIDGQEELFFSDSLTSIKVSGYTRSKIVYAIPSIKSINSVHFGKVNDVYAL